VSNGTLQRHDEDLGEPGGWALAGRRAIFDARERVVGYELLLDTGDPPADETAMAGVLATAFADVGFQRIVGSQRAYLTVCAQMLERAVELRLPPDQVVLQIAEQPLGRHVVPAAAGLVERGFGIAVGGWALGEGGEPLLRLATAVKVQCQFGSDELMQLVARRDELHRRGVTLIASAVHTRADYAECRRLGFDAFQGDYLGQPSTLAARRKPTFRASALATALDAGGAASFEDLERLIVQDAGLSCRFLRLAGSAAYAGRAPAGSIRQALARLGEHATRRWLVIMLLAGLTDAGPGSAARHMLGVGLHRARICELLARDSADACAETAFTAGLLSVLPALVDQPISDLVAEVPLHPRLAQALLDYQGPEGRLLAAMIAYEDGERENADGDPRLLAAITRIYAGSLLWADEAVSHLDRSAT
jgi:c-di-GMP phosphodiesterase